MSYYTGSLIRLNGCSSKLLRHFPHASYLALLVCLFFRVCGFHPVPISHFPSYNISQSERTTPTSDTNTSHL